jgi:hypothetical protein
MSRIEVYDVSKFTEAEMRYFAQECQLNYDMAHIREAIQEFMEEKDDVEAAIQSFHIRIKLNTLTS